jgi:hypothetical protein
MKLLVIGILTISLLMLSSNLHSFVFGQKGENKDDLVFNVQGLTTSPSTKDFQINGKVWNEICPSNQCKIEEDHYSSYVVTPKPEDDHPHIYTTLYFNVHDNVTNKNLTSLQKKIVEKYGVSLGCYVNSAKDIIERANNTIYKCSGYVTDLAKVNREKTDPTYWFDVKGTYDTQSDSLNATGKFSGIKTYLNATGKNQTGNTSMIIPPNNTMLTSNVTNNVNSFNNTISGQVPPQSINGSKVPKI